MTNNPYQKYKNTQVETASQEKLLLMLYDGAIKFLKQAIKGVEENDYEAANNYLVRTQDIIHELMATLDMEKGGEIARNLESLYDYMNRRLIEANVNKDIEPMEEVRDMLAELRETWQEAIKKVKQNKADQPSKDETNKRPQNLSGGINIEG
ncbi:flagellar export chaperone FliS [Acetohalobium arabaticum]|uniref:Flagellar secretion chaperone FliS n=1 Tax=Acetohalobium arabaticum (strain ATCC 49924 / DSM 5501 / Z-7288) TaxID=574087 RepID=D9QTP3_ACEAZ|nr:flagellar export chaperone FliS [Acetohalobium arabaticum]ADL11807.1 Hpt protein [Acetohalobium arabaticum DSM 5501]